jgi:hypothetical protein
VEVDNAIAIFRRGLECTSQIRGQPRINTFHHPEKLLCDGDDDDEDEL